MRTLLALVAAAVVACAPAQPAPEVVAFRFLEHVGGAEIDGFPAADVARPEAFRRPWVRRSRTKLVELAMSRAEDHNDNRLALPAPAGSRYRFSLHLPAQPRLRLGLGYVQPADESRQVRFHIAVSTATNADATAVLDETIVTAGADGWHDREVDLDAWAGQEVVITLETSVEPPGDLVWAAWSSPEVVQSDAAESGWDVLLISLDTLRADHLGCYGYERPTSPAIDAFAARATRFTTALSPSPWTRPAHLAIFSGLLPFSRGGLKPQPLADVLWRTGYRTEAITGGGQLDYRLGFARGFDTYRYLDWIRQMDAVIETLARTSGRKRFLFLHTYEIHDPYIHDRFSSDSAADRLDGFFDRSTWDRFDGNLTDAEKRHVIDLYDSDIAFTDSQLGTLFDRLEDAGILERTIVILTSDHGEQFWEHGGWRHGMNVFDYHLKVPLIVHLPPALRDEIGAAQGAVIDAQVRLIDLYPTILELLEVPFEHSVQGRSLTAALAGGTLDPMASLAENTNTAIEHKGLRTPEFKFVVSFPKADGIQTVERWNRALFDLRRDPGEQVNLLTLRPDIAATMERQLLEILGAGSSAQTEEEPADLDPALRERLRALGYVGN